MEIHDQTQFVPRDYPEVADLRCRGCPIKKPLRVDYTKKFFCNKWGKSFECLCPPETMQPIKCEGQGPKQFRGVGREMKSLEYFSYLPIKDEGSYPDPAKGKRTLAQRMALELKEMFPKRELEFHPTCPRGTLLKPDIFFGDTVCGTCTPLSPNSFTKNRYDCGDEFPGFDISPNLPFRVCFGTTPEPERVKLRTGAERCLQPSRYHDIVSSYKEVFTDFMKTKTPQQLSLYRSPLVIDNRRVRPMIPVNNDSDDLVIDANRPLRVNARPIKWKNCGKSPFRPPCLDDGKPDFQICVSGPIQLP